MQWFGLALIVEHLHCLLDLGRRGRRVLPPNRREGAVNLLLVNSRLILDRLFLSILYRLYWQHLSYSFDFDFLRGRLRLPSAL